MDSQPLSSSQLEVCFAPEPGFRFRSEYGWLVALWLAALIFFAPILFERQSLYFRDTGSFYFPQAWITASALKSGELPLWEPSIGLGYPFQADPHSIVFYPLTLLLLLLPWPRAYNLFVAVHVPLAGCFLYLLLRRWRFSPPSSALAAFVLMFGGYTVSATSLTTLLRGLTWMPLALLAFERYLDGGQARWLAWTALALAVHGSCTDPQYLFFTGCLLAVLPWLRPAAGRAPLRLHVRGLLGVGLLAGLLLAYQYLPLSQLFLRSDRVGGVESHEFSAYRVEPANLFNLALPLAFPDPASPYYLASFRGGEVPFYPDLYLGVPALALALASLGWLRRRRTSREQAPAGPDAAPNLSGTVVAAGVILAVSVLLSFGDLTPCISILTTVVPPLQAFRYPAKYLLIAAFMFPILVGCGFEGLWRGRRRCQLWFLTAIGLFASSAVAVIGALSLRGLALPRAFLSWRQELLGDPEALFFKVRAVWLANLWFALGVSMAILLLWLLRVRGELPPRQALQALALVLACDLMLGTCRSYPVMADAFLTDSPNVLGLLPPPAQGGPATRILSHGAVESIIGSEVTAFMFFCVQRELLSGLRCCSLNLGSLAASMSVRLASHTALVRLLDSISREGGAGQAIAATGTRYSLHTWGAEPATGLRHGPVEVREIPHPLPRVFIAARAAPAAPGERLPGAAALDDLARRAVYRPATGAPSANNILVPEAVRECKIVSYQRHLIRVEFDLAGEGLLVLLEQSYPGWRALVDGIEKPVVEVAGVFRGVHVKQGEHVLQMSYRPTTFFAGSALSVVGLLFASALLLRRSRLA